MGYATDRPLLDTTIDMLRTLNDDQLIAIQSVLKAFASDTERDFSFRQLSREEFLARVDEGLEDAENGRYEDIELAEMRLRKEFGF